MDQATLHYGYGPVPDASVTYQPDVVIVQGGPKAIRSASANGLVWTIDRDAPGAEQVRPGKVMFVTSLAVGRVVDVQPSGRDLAVTLAPVQLTEIIRDAHLKIDQDFDIDSMLFQEIPDLPGALSAPDPASGAPGAGLIDFLRPNGVSLTSPRLVLASTAPDLALAFAGWTADGPAQGGGLAAASGGLFPAPTKVKERGSIDVSRGDWEMRVFARKEKGEKDVSEKDPIDKIGMRIRYNRLLRASIQVALGLKKPHLTSDVPIANGKVAGTASTRLDGLKEIEVDVEAGVHNGADDNTRVRIELPVNFFGSIPPSPATAGIPFVYGIRLRFIVETAFSGKNSTLTASGRWELDGPVGINELPTLSVKKSILDSLGGFTIGPSGIVVAWATIFSLGVGVPIANAGPYVKVIVAAGVTKGSAVGAPLVVCRSATLDVKAGEGLGLSILAGVRGLDLKKEFMARCSTVSRPSPTLRSVGHDSSLRTQRLRRSRHRASGTTRSKPRAQPTAAGRRLTSTGRPSRRGASPVLRFRSA